MYVWVAAWFYFLLSFVGAYSRYVVHDKLLISLDGQSVAIELQAALESVESAKPRIVRDHGSEFVNRDVAKVIETHNLRHQDPGASALQRHRRALQWQRAPGE